MQPTRQAVERRRADLKPSKLAVPPWQMVSAMLGSEPLRVATCYTRPEIPDYTSKTPIPKCWDASPGKNQGRSNRISGTWKD